MTVENQHTRLADDPSMPRPGDILGGRYRVEKILGEGGFAAVFKAIDAKTGKAFAVKVLDPLMSRRDEFRRRFFLEVANSSKLNHVNTIQVSDQGETDTGCLYLVMELLEGHALDDVLHERGGMPARHVRDVGIQALLSLREAHDLNILHRDIKPANIMLVGDPNQGDEIFVKVLDFGIAKSMDGSEDAALTSTGQVMCSPHYVAPERIIDHDTFPSSDIYSLGVSMIEMLEGTPPYTGESSIQLVMMHARMDSPLPMKDSTRNSALGPILEKATHKDYTQRYQSAQEMIDALRTIDASKPVAVAAAPPTQPATTTDEDSSGGVLQYWPVALLFLIVLLVGVLMWRFVITNDNNTTSAQVTESSSAKTTKSSKTSGTREPGAADPENEAAILVDATLSADDASIYTLRSEPTGARVYIDDEYVETTPWTFEAHNLPADPPFALKLTLNDGREVTRTIDSMSALNDLAIDFPRADTEKPTSNATRPNDPAPPSKPRPTDPPKQKPSVLDPPTASKSSTTNSDAPPEAPSTQEPRPAPATPQSPTEPPAPSKPSPKPAPKDEPPAKDPSKELLEKLRNQGGGGYGSNPAKSSGGGYYD